MEEKKSNLGLWVVIGVLFVAVVGLSFYLGTKFANKEDKKETETKEEAKESKFEDVSIKDSLVADAMRFNVKYICGGPVIEFKGQNIKVDELSDEYKANVYLGSFADITMSLTEDGTYSVDDKFDDRYFKDDSFLKKYRNGEKLHFYNGPVIAEYKNGKFVFSKYATGCEGAYEGYNTQLVSARKNDKQLILDYAYYYQTYDYEKEEASIYFKKGDSKPAEQGVKVNEETYEYIIKPELYDHYEFVMDISEGKLQLTEIVYVPKK